MRSQLIAQKITKFRIISSSSLCFKVYHFCSRLVLVEVQNWQSLLFIDFKTLFDYLWRVVISGNQSHWSCVITVTKSRVTMLWEERFHDVATIGLYRSYVEVLLTFRADSSSSKLLLNHFVFVEEIDNKIDLRKLG